MEIRLANHSSYPRTGAGAARPGASTPVAADRDSARALVDGIVHEQEAAGLDIITDGQAAWGDPVSHLLAPIDGVRLNGVKPFPGSERGYLQPVINGRLRHRAPLLAGEYRLATLAARLPVKPVLTGPYTLARLSVVATTAYRSVSALAADLSAILREEILSLIEAGARFIQVDEPLILDRPQDIRLLRELLEPLHDACAGRAELAVATYFADATPLYAQLNSLPADVIALDFSSCPTLVDAVADTGSGKVLGAGLLDGRSSEMEDPAALARMLDRLLHRYAHDAIYVQPSCGLGGLERSVAAAKLGLLSAARDHLTRGMA